MKMLLSALLLLRFATAGAQSPVALRLAGSYSFAVGGFGVNDAGLGLQLQSNFFTKKPLQLRLEAGIDKFLGDKQLVVDLSGTTYDTNPTITRLMAGPEIFLAKNLSASAVYGLAWNNWYNRTSTQSGYRLSLNGHLGQRQRFLVGASYSKLLGEERRSRYASLSLGYRLF